MQNKIFRWGGVALIGLSIVLGGCNQQKAPAEAIKDGMKNLAKVNSYTMDGNMLLDLDGTADQSVKKMNTNINLALAIQGNDPNNMLLNLKLNGSFNADGDGGSGSMEMRLNKDTVYATVSQLAGQGEIKVPEEISSQVLNKWFKFTIPAEVLTNLAQNLATAKDESKMTPEQKKIKELYEKTTFFKNPTLVGTETVKGEASTHYSAVLDKEAFINFIRQVTELQGNKISDAEFADMKATFDKVENTSSDIWIANSNKVINRVSMKFAFAGSTTEPSGKLALDFSLGDFNKPVTVEVPADAVEFPMSSLLNLAISSEAGDLSGEPVESTLEEPKTEATQSSTQLKVTPKVK